MGANGTINKPPSNEDIKHKLKGMFRGMRWLLLDLSV
jgi:hypothetical protein